MSTLRYMVFRKRQGTVVSANRGRNKLIDKISEDKLFNQFNNNHIKSIITSLEFKKGLKKKLKAEATETWKRRFPNCKESQFKIPSERSLERYYKIFITKLTNTNK